MSVNREHEADRVSLWLLMKYAFEQEEEVQFRGYPTPQELKETYPDMSSLRRKVYHGIETMHKEEKRKNWKPKKILKRVLLTAAVLTSLFAATMMTSATVRNAVVNTIIDWTGRDVGIQFKIDGEPLPALPDGYGPHYIPERFQLDKENSVILSYLANLEYQSADGEKMLTICSSVIENTSQVRLDNEHTTFEMVTFQGVESYVGHWISLDGTEGYEMVWAKDGIEHYIYGTVTLSELFAIAENIY